MVKFTFWNVYLADDHTLLLESNIEQLAENDGFSAWRAKESHELTSLVQSKIKQLQNPSNCEQAKKLVCHLNHFGCGFGCLMHHASFCLLTALATQRVLILSDHPMYGTNATVKDVLAPLSFSCTQYDGKCSITIRVTDQSKQIQSAIQITMLNVNASKKFHLILMFFFKWSK